ncbi:MAG: Hpt domain-containing protein [Thermoguttaceae bacterium]
MADAPGILRDDCFDDLLGDFLDESGQLLDQLNENLLQLDEWVRATEPAAGPRRCDGQLLNEMFRSAHSLKGLSAMLGLGEINTLTHKIENVFDAARKDELNVDGDVVEVVFHSVDLLGCLIAALKEPDSGAVECGPVLDRIAALLQGAGAERRQSTQADAQRALDAQDAATDSAAAATSAPAPQGPAATPPAADGFAGLEDGQPPPQLLPIFIDEMGISLDQLNETLLALEQGGSREAIETLMCVCHRIKGSAASLELNRAAKLAHLMEDLLQQLLDARGTLGPATIDALLACSDGLRQYVEGLKQGQADSAALGRFAADLLLAGQAAGRQGEAPPEAISPQLHALVAAAAGDSDAVLVGEVFFQPGLPLAGLKGRLIYEKLAAAGEVCYFQPPPAQLDEMADLGQIGFGVGTPEPPETFAARLRISGVQRVVLERLTLAPAGPGQEATGAPLPSEPVSDCLAETPAAPGPAAAEGAEKNRAADNAKPTETLRVDIERLDQLMNLAGQLVINKARFAQIGQRLRGALGGPQSLQVLGRALGTLEKMAGGEEGREARSGGSGDAAALCAQARRLRHELESVRHDLQLLGAARTSLGDFFETIHQLDRISDGIQQGVMSARMLPIGPLLGRFKRVVRDITHANGKSICLVINGEKTELDKRMIDELGDPLIHLVRNAADHGIESPEARVAAGKPPQGTITLDAFHCGNSIIVQIQDDGGGLDTERIRRKALERGLITAADAERMPPAKVHQLIWEPGLSTAEKVTEVSGRGMGMDIVRSKIEDLSGTVEVESAPGRGTTLSIKLPLTLAILPSLMVEIAGDVFAMPLEAVVEIVRLQRRDLTTVHRQWTARVRQRVISLVRLGDVFASAAAAGHSGDPGEESTVVIFGRAGDELGLLVDRVLGEEDIVIKSLAENFRNVPGIAGASILGDGRVSLILDLAALLDIASKRCGAAPQEV